MVKKILEKICLSTGNDNCYHGTVEGSVVAAISDFKEHYINKSCKIGSNYSLRSLKQTNLVIANQLFKLICMDYYVQAAYLC